MKNPGLFGNIERVSPSAKITYTALLLLQFRTLKEPLPSFSVTEMELCHAIDELTETARLHSISLHKLQVEEELLKYSNVRIIKMNGNQNNENLN